MRWKNYCSLIFSQAIKRLLTGYQNCTKSQHMSVDMIEEQVDIYHSVNSQ